MGRKLAGFLKKKRAVMRRRTGRNAAVNRSQQFLNKRYFL